nr:nucleic acid-binding, OB-fold protein [Tanacetum cinerariifolium]
MKTKNKPVKRKMPYDLQMEYTSLHIPKKLDLKFHDSACASVPHNGRNYNSRLSLPTNAVHETSAPSNIDVIKEAYESAYNQNNNDDSLTMHTKIQDMLSTTIGNHTATSSLGTFGIQNNSFLRKKSVTNNDIKDPHTANVDNSINNGKGPYVFRVSGQIYHWIGSMCPEEGSDPSNHRNGLKKEIVEDLIEFLDNHNALVQLFRTARDKYMDSEMPKFKVRLYNVVGTRRYEVPTPEAIGAIVFGDSSTKDNEFDLIVEEHSRFPQCVNKLHPCYMSLQFPLLLVYGEEGYHKDRTFVDKEGYVHYRRRKTEVDIERQGVRLDNSKWTDRVVMNVTKPTGDTALTSTTTNIQIDEIKKFVEARYIGPHEACWRILDFPIHYRDPPTFKDTSLTQIEKTEAKMKASVLFDLEAMLNSNSKSLKDFGLPMPPQDMLKILQNKLLIEEKNYNPELLAKEKDALIPRLNTEQKDVFDEIVNAVNNNIQKLIFVYGHGGSGKTFLWKAITRELRSAEKVVLEVASSGIASLLLPSGRKHATDSAAHEKEQKKTCSAWLLNIGDGTIGTCIESDTKDSATVQIPHELCIQESDTALTELINFIYNEGTLHSPTAKDLQKKAIVCSENETADIINAKVLSLLDEPTRVYLSSDQATPHGDDGGETELLYPDEYLNSLNFARLPPHRLELKVGTRVSEKVFLSRISLINRDLQMPFVFKRKQFPVKVSYVMTINKSQGQSLEKIGIYLPEPVFAHGQLYVALTMAERKTIAPTLADKGKATIYTPEIISLKNIRPTHTNKTIEARVYRKWTAMNVTTKEPTNLYCILLDKQGSAIQANMNVRYTDHFNRILELNNPYRISRFHYFRFAAYNEIEDRADISGTPLIDYIECIHQISDPIKSGDATRSRRTRRIIDIQNLEGLNLPFVIWNKQAEGFDMAAYADMPKPVVITVSSTWETRKYGGLQLTATPATHYYLNPNIPEATYILNMYADFINPVDALQIQRQPYIEESQEQMRNRYCIETLLNVDPQHYKGEQFTTEATILEITAPNGCYCFRAIIDDETATTTITCFSPEALTFIPECNTVIASLNNQDMDTIPAALKDTENQTYIFQYHFGKKATVGNLTFTLDAVFKPNPQPLLTLLGTEQTTPPPVEFQNEEASSTKADDQSQDTNTKQRDTKAKRQLFKDQCPSNKRQRQDK